MNNSNTDQPELIANRYRILEAIGQGGMGMVFKVHDRLTGQIIALKRVTVAGEQLEFGKGTLTSGTVDMRFALAQEFKALATLRHPHIISVLDYGFTGETSAETGMPYFTMELLEDAEDIVTFGRDKPDNFKIDLLMQILQALAYLHRRGIVHRDLKPSNVLFAQNQVKVLDFGLALASGYRAEDPDEDRIVGTVAYMAPEIFRGAPSSEASDLYAVGIIAYELFGGQHPFEFDELSNFIETLFTVEPNMSQLAAEPSVTAIIERLLAKQPADRFPDANAVLNALRKATGQTIIFDISMRESYLQAARFVGRDREMAMLTIALHQTMNGHGSSWLIAGESGVGKSRLLDELRTQALVLGFIVLRGESVAETGLPYKLWRESLRRMLLTVSINDLEASILKAIVPDLPTLIGREVSDAPPLEGQAGQQRLVNVIVDVFKRAPQPVILLLEDLHWSAESLEPLKILNAITPDRPLMIVGTYRDDERPDLPSYLPGMKRLKLNRLTPQSIAELSASMLGDIGKNKEVVNLLQRETEGNTYFIVEVVRALAEDAGDLEKVDVMTLPAQVFTGGVRTVIRRRLSRVPQDAQPLLKLAAITGRKINRKIMQAIINDFPLERQYDLDKWLAIGATAAVLEIREEEWQFAHEKLREALLEDLTDDERPELHRRVALGIEAAFPGDGTWSPALVAHWHAAGNIDRAIHHASIAGERALVVGAFAEGKSLLTKLLQSLHDDDIHHRLTLLSLLGALYWRTGDYDQGALYYAENLALAHEIDDKANIARALNGLSFIDTLREDYDLAYERSELALEYANAAGALVDSARALSNLGVVAENRGELATARDYYTQSLAIFRELDDKRGIASVLNNLGSVADTLGNLEEATSYYYESLDICRTIGYRQGIATLLNNIGILNERLGDLNAAQETYRKSLSISQDIGDRRGCAHSYANLTFVAISMDDCDRAQEYVEQALEISHAMDITYIMPHVVAGYAWLDLLDGDAVGSAELTGSLLEIASQDDDFYTLRMAPLLEQIAKYLPDTEREAAFARGREMALHRVIRELLKRKS
jgi:predicted ATPase